MDKVTAHVLWDIFRHVRSWLANLDRAGKERKQQSIRALREVIRAARETAVYMRQISDTGHRDHDVERRLSVLWTDLGFALEDLGIARLAKRCRITGKHWSDPTHYDRSFLEKSDVSLERMERLATEMLHEISH